MKRRYYYLLTSIAFFRTAKPVYINYDGWKCVYGWKPEGLDSFSILPSSRENFFELCNKFTKFNMYKYNIHHWHASLKDSFRSRSYNCQEPLEKFNAILFSKSIKNEKIPWKNTSCQHFTLASPNYRDPYCKGSVKRKIVGFFGNN